jgi:hypothetical protein
MDMFNVPSSRIFVSLHELIDFINANTWLCDLLAFKIVSDVVVLVVPL